MKLTFTLLLAVVTLLAHAQTRQEGPWWPNKLWGANDQVGATNWITPEKIIKSMALVRTGKTIELGHVYEREMPNVGQRSYHLFIPSFPTYPATGKDSIVFNDELVVAELGQVGTQFDGLGHPGKKMKLKDGTTTEVFYNGIQGNEMKNPYGLQKLGVENVKPIITRGILIDLAASKNIPTLPEGYLITMDDIRQALSKQGMKETDIEPGDALLFNLGWWRHWPEKITTEGKPASANQEVIDWIIGRKPCMIGSDASMDAAPDFPVHEDLILKNGINNMEYMDFKDMEQEKRYIFLFIFTPLRLKGATGSPGRPLAIL
jgi:kynurenine formamidase